VRYIKGKKVTETTGSAGQEHMSFQSQFKKQGCNKG